MTSKLYLGDCTEILPTIGRVGDVIITDPPYGVDYEYDEHEDTAENLEALARFIIERNSQFATRTVIFTGVKNLRLYGEADWTYAWVCPAGTGVSPFGFTCWTPIAFFGKDPYSGKGSRPDVFVDYKPKRTGVDHPCEKPLSVMQWAIERFSLPGETVIDPFMGSGTTGVAAAKMGRNFIGIEKTQKYYDIAEHRIAEAEMQPILF